MSRRTPIYPPSSGTADASAALSATIAPLVMGLQFPGTAPSQYLAHVVEALAPSERPGRRCVSHARRGSRTSPRRGRSRVAGAIGGTNRPSARSANASYAFDQRTATDEIAAAAGHRFGSRRRWRRYRSLLTKDLAPWSSRKIPRRTNHNLYAWQLYVKDHYAFRTVLDALAATKWKPPRCSTQQGSSFGFRPLGMLMIAEEEAARAHGTLTLRTRRPDHPAVRKNCRDGHDIQKIEAHSEIPLLTRCHLSR